LIDIASKMFGDQLVDEKANFYIFVTSRNRTLAMT